MSDQGPGGSGGPAGDPQYPGSDPYGYGYGTPGGYGQGAPGYPGGGSGTPGSGGSGSGGQRGVIIGLGAVIVAGLVVIVLAATGVFSGSSGTGGGGQPVDAARTLMQASVDQDLGTVKTVVCQKDLDDPDLDQVVSDKEHATTFSIGSVDQQSDDRAVVDVSITTSDGSDSAKLPVIRENGAWKVCLSEIGSGFDPSDSSSASSSTASPSTSDETTPSSSDTDTAATGFCASSADAASTARLFISYITLGNTSDAASCVYAGRVSTSELEALIGDGKIYSPSLPAGQTGPTFSVTSVDDEHKLTFRVDRQSDGKYYVVSASGT